MKHKTRTELAVFLVLLVLLSISVFSQFSSDNPAIVSSRTAKYNPRGTALVNEGLDIHLLSNEVPEFSEVKRNIFQFGAGAGSAEAQPPVIRVPQTQPAVPEIPAVPEVHYLGFYLEKETGLKMASLSNSGRVYVGKVGQVLSGRYQVMEIAPDHVILKLLLQEGKIIRVPLGKSPGIFVEGYEEQEQQ